MQIAIFDEIQSADPNSGMQIREGGAKRDFRLLFKDDAPDGFNFWMARVTQNDEGEDRFATPRHKHTFQQIKFAEKGPIDVMPGQNIDEGDLGYFPKGAWYGPQQREKGPTSIGLQYGFNGEHQRGEYWESRRAEVLKILNSRGIIENGLFIERHAETGETITRDAVDALYDERYRLLKGKPLVIPEATYDAPIIMHPRNASYYQAAAGLEMKPLGRFYDQPGPHGDVSISMVRLSGGVLELEPDRPQVLWTLREGLKAGNEICPAGVAIYCPRGDAGQISGDDGLEAYLVEFPRLD